MRERCRVKKDWAWPNMKLRRKMEFWRCIWVRLNPNSTMLIEMREEKVSFGVKVQ